MVLSSAVAAPSIFEKWKGLLFSVTDLRAPSFLRRFARRLRQQLYPIPHLSELFIRRAGKRFGQHLRTGALCVDIGSGVSPHRSIAEQSFDIAQYIALDLAASDSTDLVADATQLPFEDSCVD